MPTFDSSAPEDAPVTNPSPADPALGRLRILVAEDEFLLGLQLEEELQSAGHAILGPYTSVAEVTHACRTEQFDLALLDVNLHGELIYPLVDELAARGVPFVLLSGYGTSNLPERFRASPRVAKPHDPATLSREIRQALRKSC